MADIADNLGKLASAYEANDCDVPCLANQTELFFVHCVPHLMAAGQIYDEIPQLFEEQKGVHDWNDFVDEEATK
jgi:hypothetical protein